MNPTAKAYRISKLEPKHSTVLSALTSVGQSLATIAAAVGITLDDAEKKLSTLVDEGLATRTAGSRITAKYASV